MSRTRTALVVVTEPLAPAPAAWLAERAEVRACPSDDPRFSAALAGADGLVVRTYTQVDETLLDRAPRLRVVARAGVGFDNIDVAACRRRGIEVVYAPDANTQAVVEYVLAVLLDALRPRERVSGPLSLHRWQALRDGLAGERELGGIVVGILGLGRIGRRLAAVLAALGTTVLYHDLVEIPGPERHGAAPVESASALFTAADAVSIHVDGRPGNRGLVGARLLGHLRDHAILVNSSRGFVVDSAALAAWLRAHRAARAVLDVHEPEPILADHPLLGVPNARLTPHIAGRTAPALEGMSWVVRDVVAVLEGRPPRHPALL